MVPSPNRFGRVAFQSFTAAFASGEIANSFSNNLCAESIPPFQSRRWKNFLNRHSNERVACPCCCDIEKALKLLLFRALDRVFQILRFVLVGERDNPFPIRGRCYEAWITRRWRPQIAREERHDHRLPFRPFCLVRSDELDRVVVSGKTDGA